MPFFRPENLSSPPDSSDSPVVAHSSRVDLSTPKHYINTLSITPTSSPTAASPPPAVILHGYGAGLGFFFRNFQSLARWAGRRNASVYALDWLGMGRSARVPFTIKSKREDIPGRVHEAENFFVDSLEEWRVKMGLEKMSLVGHSLGAYLSVVYALKYPGRVDKLILLSPAGVPRGPDDLSLPSREVTDQEATGTGAAEVATQGKVDDIRKVQQMEKRQESRTRKLFTYLWEEGWSPFQAVRATLFWGPMLVGKVCFILHLRRVSMIIDLVDQYSSRRFTGLSEEDTRDMHDYILNITLAKGSGEYCICECSSLFFTSFSLTLKYSPHIGTWCTCSSTSGRSDL